MRPICQFRDHPTEQYSGRQTLYCLGDDFFYATDRQLVKVYVRDVQLATLNNSPLVEVAKVKILTDMGLRMSMIISLPDAVELLAQIAEIERLRAVKIDPLLISNIDYQAAVADAILSEEVAN